MKDQQQVYVTPVLGGSPLGLLGWRYELVRNGKFVGYSQRIFDTIDQAREAGRSEYARLG